MGADEIGTVQIELVPSMVPQLTRPFTRRELFEYLVKAVLAHPVLNFAIGMSAWGGDYDST